MKRDVGVRWRYLGEKRQIEHGLGKSGLNVDLTNVVDHPDPTWFLQIGDHKLNCTRLRVCRTSTIISLTPKCTISSHVLYLWFIFQIFFPSSLTHNMIHPVFTTPGDLKSRRAGDMGSCCCLNSDWPEKPWLVADLLGVPLTISCQVGWIAYTPSPAEK